jgi:hypothetical protein
LLSPAACRAKLVRVKDGRAMHLREIFEAFVIKLAKTKLTPPFAI